MPQTLVEKLLARAANLDAAPAGTTVDVYPDIVMFNDSFFRAQALLAEYGIDKLHAPERIHVIFDHNVPPRTREMANRHSVARARAIELGVKNLHGYAGVSHQVLCERGIVLPGQTVLGTDSHSSMYGALGAAGMGMGATEAVFTIAAGFLPIRVPTTARIRFTGTLPIGVMAMDIILHLLGKFGRSFAIGRALEFAGDGASALPVPARMTIANMGVEMGAQFSLFPADDIAALYAGNQDLTHLSGDDDANVDEEINVDLGKLCPQVAFPPDPGNVRSVGDAQGTAITHAYLGSCTNGRIEDIRAVDAILSGRKVPPEVTFTVTPASRKVLQQAIDEGIVSRLMDADVHLGVPGCGACFGGNQSIGDGEVCIATINRNFVGRMGSVRSDVYLASPATVAASALTGRITDPREITTEICA